MDTGIKLDPKSPQHAKLLNGIKVRLEHSREKMQTFRRKCLDREKQFSAFVRETDADRARAVKRDAGDPQYTTITLPYSYGMQTAAHTFWTNVFFSRDPLFQYTGYEGRGARGSLAAEAVIEYQRVKGEMLPPLYVWLYDAAIYGVGVVSEYWADERSQVVRIEEIDEVGPLGPTGRKIKQKTFSRMRSYAGNRIFNVRPTWWFPDPRQSLQDFQKGEFCGCYFELGWNDIVRKAKSGDYINIEELKRRGPNVIRDSEFDDGVMFSKSDEGNEDNTYGTYGLYNLQWEIIPDEWGLGLGRPQGGDYPEKWVFTIDASCSLIIQAAPLGYLHDKFTYNVLVVEPYGYSNSPRSIGEVLQPLQNIMDWQVNTHFYSMRKTMNGMMLVDPRYVDIEAMRAPTLSGLIFRNAAASNVPADEIVKQLNVGDATRANLMDMKMIDEIAQKALGINEQVLGGFAPSGRRSASEIRTSTGFSTNRLETAAGFFSCVGFAPMGLKILQNTQQYMDEPIKRRLIGDLANAMPAGNPIIDIMPEDIMGAYDFLPVDGTAPMDRFAMANLWRELLGQIAKIPPLMQTFDVPGIFAWVAQQSGLKSINQFRINFMPDAALQQQAQGGNMVPLRAVGTQPPPPKQVGTGPLG